jgi:hypothetical protein
MVADLCHVVVSFRGAPKENAKILQIYHLVVFSTNAPQSESTAKVSLLSYFRMGFREAELQHDTFNKATTQTSLFQILKSNVLNK